jgi:hypothetical protein
MRLSFHYKLVPVLVFLAALAGLVSGGEPAWAASGSAAKAPPAPRAGCDRIGKRALTAILRDDIVSANDLAHLYERFACDVKHLRRALDCAAEQQPLAQPQSSPQTQQTPQQLQQQLQQQQQQVNQAAAVISTCWSESGQNSPAKGKTKAAAPAKK